MTSMGESSASSSSRMSSSQTLSSGLHVQSELLNEIATLRSALAQSNQQLERAHAAGYMSTSSRALSPAGLTSQQSRRDRRVTMPASTGHYHNNSNGNARNNNSSSSSKASSNSPKQQQNTMSISTSAAQRHRRNSSAVVGHSPSSRSSTSTPDGQQHSSRATTHNANQSTPRSASVIGYAGAAPSSLATPTSASVPSFTLRRDTAYDDLARVMNTASPAMAPRTSSLNASTASGLGISPPPHKRMTSMNNGTPTSASKTAMPAFPPGMVGTATTLAGGSNSPKTPLSVASDKASCDGTPVRPTRQASSREDGSTVPNGVLRDATNGAVRNPRHSDSPLEEEEDKLSNSAASTLHLPPLPTNGQNVPPGMRSPHLSSDGEGEYSPTATMASIEDEVRLPTRRQSKSSNGARGGSSPFFGGSAGFTERHAARIASSQSGTSKVIMSLQTDLTNSRTQLEHTRTQLRASARAVESLTRQIEDLKEGKERSRLELQGMSTTLARRERMLEETLTRARSAETNLKALEDEKKSHYGECSKKIKELENRCREAEERRAKAESEYMALRSASSNLAGGFAKEVKALKKELHSAKLKSEQDRNDARTRQASVTKLLTTRTSVQEDVTTALQDLSVWQRSMQKQYQSTIDTLSAQYVQSQKDNEVLTKRTQEVLDELMQYKKAMRAYDSKLGVNS